MDSERVVVVTGGASGIGLGIVKAFLKSGHPVAMLDVQEALLERESAALRTGSSRLLARKADVSKRAEVEAAYAAIRKELGPIAIVVANAGISSSADFLTMSVETWQQMIDVNLTGVFHTIQPALADMVAAKWGRIPPCLVDTPLAREGERTGQVPPLEAIAKAVVPIGRAGTPDDIAGAVEFLASDKASYITGQELNVNGGSWC